MIIYAGLLHSTEEEISSSHRIIPLNRLCINHETSCRDGVFFLERTLISLNRFHFSIYQLC